MKLAARDIDGFLRQPDRQCRAVLIYGPDGGLAHERARKVAAFITAADPDALNRVELTGDHLKADPARLHDELAAFNLLGGRRVIMLRDLPEKLAPLIEEAFEAISTTTYLIVEAEELGGSSALRSLFERRADFAALPCYRDEGRALEDTIRSFFAAASLRVAPDALHYLSNHLGSDRGVTMSELQKITTYMGPEKEVTLATARELTEHNASETIEDICHATASGKVKASHALLERLLYEGIQPVAIIRSLMRYFQRLELLRAQVDAGQPAEAAIQSLRPPVFFKAVPLLKRELGLWNRKSLNHALNLFLLCEKELKSSVIAPPLALSDTLTRTARLAA